MSTDELAALGGLPVCPNCGGRKWSLAGEIGRMGRGFLRGWNYVAELRCDACRTTIAAGWGGQLG
jgi:hypothetical protein